jgi:superfamily II DNA/RNA helicase
VRDLARLSLRDPEYLAVHAEAGAPTPAKLQQAVMEVALPQKLDALWSFVKTHLRVGAITGPLRRIAHIPAFWPCCLPTFDPAL